MLNVFLSYNFQDQDFVTRVYRLLRKQPDLRCYFYREDIRLDSWRKLISRELGEAVHLILFAGSKLGKTQQKEAAWFAKQYKKEDVARKAITVCLPSGGLETQSKLNRYRDCRSIVVKGLEGEAARDCAREIAGFLTRRRWISDDDLPLGYPFAYEKDIIQAYAIPDDDHDDRRKVRLGCPENWPTAEKVENETDPGYDNPLREDIIGNFRKEEGQVLVDARSVYHVSNRAMAPLSHLVGSNLTFPEAGPRATLRFPPQGTNLLTVGLLVSGGIAPGINAVLSGIVERHKLYADPPATALRVLRGDYRRYKLKILGFRDGFSGLLDGTKPWDLSRKEDWHQSFPEMANEGGSKIGTSRWDELLSSSDFERRDSALERVVNNLRANNIDILYVIGGDGSMKAAHAIWTRAREMRKANRTLREISVVAVPKTMDNDILWVWQSFGFLSAVERAKEAIRLLHTEVRSNPRLCVVQLFGSDSGFVVSHAALASGVCDAALIPEVGFSMRRLSDYIKSKLRDRYNPSIESERPYGLIVMAETAIPQDVEDFIDDEAVGLEEGEKGAIRRFINEGRRVQGQTPDALRTGSLKIVSRVLQSEIQQMKKDTVYWENFRVFTNEPRHLLRAIAPSALDVIFAHRLGVLAVDNAMAGYTDFMISQWLTEYVLVPIKLVVLGRKRVPPHGIFWKSVLAHTGQPESLEDIQRDGDSIEDKGEE